MVAGMALSLAAANPDTTHFEATVEAISDTTVVLDETYFYPESGGQPADRGTIAGYDVDAVSQRNDRVEHVLTMEPKFEVGDTVVGSIDPAFRTYCRRAHSASHVLYGAGRRLFDDLGYGGFDISEQKIRVDFATATDIDDETMLELERLVNRCVWENRTVSWETRTADEALSNDEIAFNTKTEEGIAGDTVRIVSVEDWDIAACGGTHVRETIQIGPVSILERSNPGQGLTRIEFAVGPPGIDQWITQKRAALAAATASGTALEELPEEIKRLNAEIEELQAENSELTKKLVDAKLSALASTTFERQGNRWLVGAIDGLDATALGENAKSAAGEQADIVALVGSDGGTVLGVAAASGDASDIVEAVTDEFGGGGGGSPQFAQGGGISVPPDRVVDFLRNEATL